MGESLLVDVESNGLLQEATVLHCIQTGSLDGTDVTIYTDALPGHRSLAEGLARLKAADRLIGHNFVAFDARLINKLYPDTVRFEQIIDTLILARLKDPEERSHSLDAHGQRLGVLKGSFKGPWDTLTPEMLDYARQDIVVTRALWRSLQDVLTWGPVVEIEHRFAHVIALLETNGFRLDVPAAQALEAELRGEVAAEAERLRAVFPPQYVAVRVKGEPVVVIPKRDDKRRGYTAGAPFCRVELQVFNPGSRQQVGARLQQLGWKPRDFGADGAPTLDDTILNNLPYPEAKRLAVLFTLQKRLGQLADGKAGWLKLVHPDGRVRGRVNTIGAAPGRCSHSTPNMAQVAKDKRMRGVWKPRVGWKLVGVDAEGLQARGLAHYLYRYDAGAYANKILTGNKAEKTDEHSSNLAVLPYLQAGFKADPATFSKARDGSKRALYAVLFGASDPKLGWTIKDGCRNAGIPVPRLPDRELGALARQGLFRAIRGFEHLSQALLGRVKERGYLTSPSGRHVKIRSRHSALVFLLQAVEADVMKVAAGSFYFEVCPQRGWIHGQDYGFTASVHDEMQIETRPEIAEEIGKAFADCIVEAGQRLGLKCPLAGSYEVGDDWSQTH